MFHFFVIVWIVAYAKPGAINLHGMKEPADYAILHTIFSLKRHLSTLSSMPMTRNQSMNLASVALLKLNNDIMVM